MLQELATEGSEKEEGLGDVVEEEMAATSYAVEEAARRIQVRGGVRGHQGEGSVREELIEQKRSPMYSFLPLHLEHQVYACIVQTYIVQYGTSVQE